MLEVQRKYLHNYKDVDSYFIESSNIYNEEIYIENDIMYVRGEEAHCTILNKSLKAMKFFKENNKEYDFTIRTNISTIFNIPKLINLLNEYRDIEYLYGGDIAGLYRNNCPIRFALGTCIILSKKLSDFMIENIDLFNHNIEDDISYGLFVGEHIPDAFNHELKMGKHVLYSNSLENGYNTKLDDFINFIKDVIQKKG
jgi:hypothetical protein